MPRHNKLNLEELKRQLKALSKSSTGQYIHLPQVKDGSKENEELIVHDSDSQVKKR